MTLGEALRAARRRLADAGIGEAALDARVLARHAFGFDGAGLIARDRDVPDPASLAAFEALVARRLAGEPVGRILGVREFHGLDFALGSETLEPRPDTETLVEVALAAVRRGDIPGADAKGTGLLFADLGTGTGAIAVSLLVALPGARAIATDISAEALETARQNADRHGVLDRLSLRLGDWLDPVDRPCGMVLSNPPYIRSADIAALQPEVRLHDPLRALDGGGDGLDAYRAIAAEVVGRLLPGGLVGLEIGFDQAADVSTLLVSGGLDSIKVHTDIEGRNRVVSGRRIFTGLSPDLQKDT